MQNRKMIVAGAALLALASAGAANAQGAAPGAGDRADGPRGPMAERMMQRHGGMGGIASGARGVQALRAADENGDGLATRAEVEALADAVFAYRDRNGDGVLDRQDLGPLAQRVAERRAERIAERMEDRADDPWARPGPRGPAGAGEERQITRVDLTERFDRMFADLDLDGDGAISAEEVREGAPDRPGGMRRGL